MICERFVCREPGGRVSRVVRPLPPYPAVVLDTWDKLHGVASMFSWDGTPPPDAIETLLDPLNHFFLVDDVGLAAVVPTDYPGIAHVHCTFWDRRMRGREDMCRGIMVHCLRYGFFEYLTAAPMATQAYAFALRVGFTPYEQHVIGDRTIVTLRMDIKMLHGATPSSRAA